MDCVLNGWVGGRGMEWNVGTDGKLKAGQAIHWNSKSNVMYSVCGLDRHNRQSMPRQPLKSAWYHWESY